MTLFLATLLALTTGAAPAGRPVAEAAADSVDNRAMQVTRRAEQAAEAARKAAQKAAGARQKAAEPVRDRQLPTEEFLKLVNQQQRDKERAANAMKPSVAKRDATEDSLRMVANLRKRREWTMGDFAGASLATSYLVADNVTDHPPFRYCSYAFQPGLQLSAGRYFTQAFGLRLQTGLHRASNRMDHEWVNAPQYKTLYDSKGYYHFPMFELFADALFDISGTSSARRYHPLHVYAILGAGLFHTGRKSMSELHTPEAEAMRNDPGREYKLFEELLETSSHTTMAARAGLLFDYRLSREFSLTFEGTAAFAGDRLEGIKYDEPFDIVFLISAGVRYHLPSKKGR